MITDSSIDNDNKKRRQQNNGKVHLKESAEKPSSAKKGCYYWWFDGEKYKALQIEQIKSLKDQQVSVKSFPGALIRSMKRYIQPTLEENQPTKFYYMWEPMITLQPKMPKKLRQKSWS